ncbi:MAG: hypothetical protein JWN75_487 [Candidatus Saccharibacteria bacterium]|nr:hypothetical protein [Candidatus Saccharibacteria bacterium]
MQQIVFTGELLTITPNSNNEHEDGYEPVTDVNEIKAIIRRAVTITFKDYLFNHDELATLLNNNDVVLPVPMDERNEWLDQMIGDILHDQQEIARVALSTLPRLIRTPYEGDELLGIVIPNQIQYVETVESTALNAAAVTELPSAANDEVIQPTRVSELSENVISIEHIAKKPALNREEIAAVLFDNFVDESPHATKINIQQIMAIIQSLDTDTSSREVRDTLKIMVDNMYLSTYKTGKNKQQQTWYVMQHEIKEEVLSEINDGNFDECVTNVFGDDEEVA